MKVRNRNIGFIVLVLFPWLCTAQLALSLEDAIKIGLRNSFDIRIAEMQSDVSKKNESIGPEGQFPTANFQLNQENRFSFDSSPTSFVDGSFSENELAAMVDVSWTVFDGHQVRINKSRLRQLVEQSESYAQIAVENTIHGIMLAYHQVLLEQQKLQALEAICQLSTQKVKWAKTMNHSGAMSNYNLLNYQNALLTDSVDLEYQRIQYKQSVRQLKNILNIDPRRNFRLTGQLRISKQTFPYEKMKGRLVRNNRDLKTQYLNILLLENQKLLAEAEKKPSIRLRTGGAHEMNTSKFKDNERTGGRVFDYYINFGLSYRLTGHKAMNKRIQITEIEKQMATIGKDKMKVALSNQLLDACERYEENRYIFDLQQQLIENLEKGLEIQEERFESGYSQFLEFRSLHTNFLQSKLKLIEIIYDLKVTEIEILKLTGGLSKH